MRICGGKASLGYFLGKFIVGLQPPSPRPPHTHTHTNV